MLGGVSQSSNQLSSIYNAIGSQLADSLAKIASGKRTYKPTEDFGGYLKANAVNASILTIQREKETIVKARETTQAAVKFGQQVFEQVGKLRDIAKQYTAAAGDAATRASLAAQGAAIEATLLSFVNAAEANGTVLNNAIITLTGAQTGNVTLSSSTLTATITAINVTDGGTTADTALSNVAAYTARMQTNDDLLKDMSELADTVMTSLENTRSAIEDINDVQELAKVTDLQIRQQAAVSMMTQADVSRSAIGKLFS